MQKIWCPRVGSGFSSKRRHREKEMRAGMNGRPAIAMAILNGDNLLLLLWMMLSNSDCATYASCLSSWSASVMAALLRILNSASRNPILRLHSGRRRSMDSCDSGLFAPAIAANAFLESCRAALSLSYAFQLSLRVASRSFRSFRSFGIVDGSVDSFRYRSRPGQLNSAVGRNARRISARVAAVISSHPK